MNWRLLGAALCGGAFQIVNFAVLFLTGTWLRFSKYEAQMMSRSGNFLIPGGNPNDGLDTMDVLIYRSLPFAVVVLLMVSSVCLFAYVRLSK